MKINILLSFLLLLFLSSEIFAQIDSSLFTRTPQDTGKPKLNMDAIYNRPFLSAGKVPVTLGGYVESNYQHISTDGLTEGHQFQFRRLTLFVASSISKRVKFLTEIEFEHDGDEAAEGKPMEIAIEYAALDFEFDPMLNLRGGIVLNPIGAFNQNHDGPKWEFIDRPIPMTEMLPATWSNTGFGLYGKKYKGNWMFGYEAYLTGGFSNVIIDNDHGKTFLPEASEDITRFSGSASGTPLTTAKVAIRNSKIGELGLSYMGGLYNKYMSEGIVIDNKRRLDVVAVDFNTSIPKTKTTFVAEAALVQVQIPDNYSPFYGSKQFGAFADVVQPVLKRKMFGWDNAVLNVALRFEYTDWNAGTISQTQTTAGDQMWSIMPAVSFRPTPQTVIRFNYRIMQERDYFMNDPAKTGGFLFGFSSYF